MIRFTRQLQQKRNPKSGSNKDCLPDALTPAAMGCYVALQAAGHPLTTVPENLPERDKGDY